MPADCQLFFAINAHLLLENRSVVDFQRRRERHRPIQSPLLLWKSIIERISSKKCAPCKSGPSDALDENSKCLLKTMSILIFKKNCNRFFLKRFKHFKRKWLKNRGQFMHGGGQYKLRKDWIEVKCWRSTQNMRVIRENDTFSMKSSYKSWW